MNKEKSKKISFLMSLTVIRFLLLLFRLTDVIFPLVQLL